jgi:L-fucose isomerase-like protein
MNDMTVKVRIGFVPTYRFRYSDWCRRMLTESVAALAATPGLELVRFAGGDEGSIHTLDQAEEMTEALRREHVDGIVICALDFGDERSVAKVAEHLQVPVLLYATKEPPAQSDSSLARVSDSYCGNLGIAMALNRRKLPFHFAGIFLPHEREFALALAQFSGAVAVVKGLRNARIGQVGVRPPSFETVAYDEIALIRKFGQNIIFRNTDDVSRAALDIPADDAELKRVSVEIRQSVAHVSVKPEQIEQMARLECALAAFYEKERLSMLAVQCWPTIGRSLGIEVCSTFGRMTGRRMLTACEADVLGGLSMIASYQAALGATLPHFIDWTIQHREKPNWLLAWHCGNAPVCLAADPKQTALRSRGNMTGDPAKVQSERGGLFQFQLKPGAVTICRIAQYDDEWRMLLTRGKIVPSSDALAGTWSWVEVADHAGLYRTLVEEGFIHHASLIHGNQREALLQACKFLRIKPVVVD